MLACAYGMSVHLHFHPCNIQNRLKSKSLKKEIKSIKMYEAFELEKLKKTRQTRSRKLLPSVHLYPCLNIVL